MLSQVQRQLRAFGSHSPSRSVVATTARALAIRKQIEPHASGRQPLPTRASVSTAVINAAVVLRLKKSVPTNWTAAAHQSDRSARLDPRRGGRRPLSASWMSAASVKKIAPMKNVRFVTISPDRIRVERDGAEREEHGSDRESPRLASQAHAAVWRHDPRLRPAAASNVTCTA